MPAESPVVPQRAGEFRKRWRSVHGLSAKERDALGLLQDRREYAFEIQLSDTVVETAVSDARQFLAWPMGRVVAPLAAFVLVVVHALLMLVSASLAYATVLVIGAAAVTALPRAAQIAALAVGGCVVMWRCVLALGLWAATSLREWGLEPAAAAAHRERHFWISEQSYLLRGVSVTAAQLLTVYIALLGITVLRGEFAGQPTLVNWLGLFSYHFADALCLSALSTLEVDWREILPTTFAARLAMFVFASACAIGYVASSIETIAATTRLTDSHRGTRLSLLDMLDARYQQFSLDITVFVIDAKGRRAVSGEELIRSGSL